MPFSFLNAALLAGIAAGALPILIHLFSRRKVARIPFSSLRFLEQISRRRVKRVRLTQWIILALRVLAIVLLAFALGRPAFRGDFTLGQSRGESAVAIVLDRSYSMRAEGARQTVWERARDRVEEVLDVLEDRDRVFFVGVTPGEDAIDVYPDPGSARDALRAMEPGYGTTDLGAGVHRAAAALAEATALNKELFLISDFQAVDTDAGLLGLTGDVGAGTRVYLLPVGEPGIDNTTVEDVRLEGSAVDRRVRVLLSRHGDTTAQDLAVTVEAGSEVLGEALLDVPPGAPSSGEVALTRLPGEGEAMEVRIPRDRLPVDDVRYIPPVGTGQVATLLVQDPAQQSPYLPLALSPEADGRFAVQRIPPASLGSVDLGSFDLLVLDNVTYLPRESLTRLRQWRAAGGLLLVALGDRTDLRFYNEDLLPALLPDVTLGNLLGTDEATGTSYTLTPRAAGHAAFAGFEVGVGEPLTGASFWRIVEVQTGPDVRVLAEFGPGLPALVEGSGALLFASSLDGRWNNLPTHAAFLPLMHQAVEALLREQGGGTARVGEPLRLVVEAARLGAGEELLCRGPGGTELGVTTQSVRRGVELVTEPPRIPGFYTLEAAGRVLARRAVNIDPAESDLTLLGNEDLAELFPGDRVTRLAFGEPVRSTVREARYGREFWKEIVALVLLILLVEAWLARRGVV